MERFTLWVDAENKIVSFHEAPRFEIMIFGLREYFLSYVQSLSEAGYRFQ